MVINPLPPLYIWLHRHKEKKSLIKQKYHKRKIKLKPKIRNYIKRYFKSPINAWLCGHSHIVNHKIINDVYCGINSASD
jgi:hypothetical protein